MLLASTIRCRQTDTSPLPVNFTLSQLDLQANQDPRKPSQNLLYKMGDESEASSDSKNAEDYPRRPSIRSLSITIPSYITSASVAHPLDPQKLICGGVANLIPDIELLWNIVNHKAIAWSGINVAKSKELSYLSKVLVRSNTGNSKKLQDDAWFRNIITSHFRDVSEHCSDIATGKISKTEGDPHILSTMDPKHPGMSPIYHDCVSGEGGLYDAARNAAREFLDAQEDPQRTIYRHTANVLNDKLSEIIHAARIIRTRTSTIAKGLEADAITTVELISTDEMRKLDELMRIAAEVSDSSPYSTGLRVDALQRIKTVRSFLETRRTKLDRQRIKKPSLRDAEAIGVTDSEKSPSNPKTGNEDPENINHAANDVQFIRSLWWEILFLIQFTIASQLACYEWIEDVQEAFEDTCSKIRELRKNPDVRFFIYMKEKRMGKRDEVRRSR